MDWSYRLFGTREWALRLPNVLSYVLYSVFGLLLLRRLTESWLVLLGFALLTLNPFLLDFFGLARGYGLALGFSMAALFFLKEAWLSAALIPTSLFLLLSLTCASVADLANYAWLNVHFSLLAAGLVLVLFDRPYVRLKLNRETLASAALLTGANALLLRSLVQKMRAFQFSGRLSWAMSETGAVRLQLLSQIAKQLHVPRIDHPLYIGGPSDFLRDTLGSLIDCYFYTRRFPLSVKQGIMFFTVGGLLLVLGVLSYRTWKNRKISFSAVLAIVFILAVAASIAEHVLVGIIYPADRTALYFIPLMALTAVFAIDENLSLINGKFRLIATAAGLMLTGAMVIHFCRTANLHHTYLWDYDAETKRAMLDIKNHFGSTDRRINIGNNWEFEPTINYYRSTLHYNWLNPARRDRLFSDANDVVYCFSDDLENRQASYSVLQKYPETGTVLLKAHRSPPQDYGEPQRKALRHLGSNRRR